MTVGTFNERAFPSRTPVTEEYEAWNRTESAKSVERLGKFLDILEAHHPDILEAAAVKQQKINNRPKTISPGFGSIASLPSGEPFDEFARRVKRLGLQGTSARNYILNLGVLAAGLAVEADEVDSNE